MLVGDRDSGLAERRPVQAGLAVHFRGDDLGAHPRASRMAMASSWPGSQSRMIGLLTARHVPPASAAADRVFVQLFRPPGLTPGSPPRARLGRWRTVRRWNVRGWPG